LLRVWKNAKYTLISRVESASPATGSHHQHDKEQKSLVNKAFAKSLVTN
jgi:2-oxoglutarate dehydrogenase complex dehydrogenase (E1) component-like enzyme